jgi:hypothetical protein
MDNVGLHVDVMQVTGFVMIGIYLYIFFGIKCGQRRPFGGDLALQYYGNPGVIIFCNDCLMNYEEKLRGELGWNR